MKKWILLIILTVVLFAITANAAEVTVTWSPSERATGYNLYIGTASGNYTYGLTPYDTGDVTTYTLTIPKLQDDQEYFFALTAYNQYGESAKSEEVSATIAGKHAVPDVPVMTRMVIKYDNGDVVDFDYVARTVTTTPAGGTPVVQTF